jgi:hypothetical protein
VAHVLPADQVAKSPDWNDVVHVPFTHIVTQSPGAGKPMDLRGTSEVCTKYTFMSPHQLINDRNDVHVNGTGGAISYYACILLQQLVHE